MSFDGSDKEDDSCDLAADGVIIAGGYGMAAMGAEGGDLPSRKSWATDKDTDTTYYQDYNGSYAASEYPTAV